MISALIPILIVPIVFGIIAIALVYIIQFFAGLISRVLSRWLDSMTWSEINRSALGNDTESEVALSAASRPVWLDRTPSFLPPELGDHVAARSNEAAVISIAKFRNALSEMAFVDGAGEQERSLLAYLTWQELIHMVYFDVAQVRSVIAHAIATSDGFSRTTPAQPGNPTNQNDAATWLAALTPAPAANPSSSTRTA